MLAKNLRAPRSFWFSASSLTTFAGKPAPTGVRARFNDQVGYKAASLCF
ncbi:hypothetical protein C4K00_4577 [Pseudomonas synxantha]|nr:hypothetical protein C4K00_4577 [Pseudomonas synxantha]